MYLPNKNLFQTISIAICLLLATQSSLSAQTRATFTLNEGRLSTPQVNYENNGRQAGGAAGLVTNISGSGGGRRYVSNPVGNGVGVWEIQRAAGPIVGFWRALPDDRLTRLNPNDRIRFDAPGPGGVGTEVSLTFYAVRAQDVPAIGDQVNVFVDEADAREKIRILNLGAERLSDPQTLTVTVQAPTYFTFAQDVAATLMPNADAINPGDAGVLVNPELITSVRTAIPGASTTGYYVSNPMNNAAGDWQVQTAGAGPWSNIAEGVGLTLVGSTDRIRFRPIDAGGGLAVSLTLYAARNASGTYAANHTDEAAARTAFNNASTTYNGDGLSVGQELSFVVAGVPATAQRIDGFTLASPGTSGDVITLPGRSISQFDNSETGLPIAYESSNPAVAEVRPAAGGSGFELALLAVGTATITASQGSGRAANDIAYLAATPVTQPITVGISPQEITFEPAPNRVVGDVINLRTGASSGLEVTFAITAEEQPAGIPVAEGTVAILVGNTLTLVGEGMVTISASQEGGTNATTRIEYEAAPDVERTLTVMMGGTTEQTITFSEPDDDILVETEVAVLGDVINLAALSSSGLFVRFSVENIDRYNPRATEQPSFARQPPFATLTDNGNGTGRLELITSGTVVVTATQVGNGTYAAAPPVTRTIQILPAFRINEGLFPDPRAGQMNGGVQIQTGPIPDAVGNTIVGLIASIGGLGSGLRYVSNPINNGVGSWQIEKVGGTDSDWEDIPAGPGLIKVGLADRVRFMVTGGVDDIGTEVCLTLYAGRARRDPDFPEDVEAIEDMYSNEQTARGGIADLGLGAQLSVAQELCVRLAGRTAFTFATGPLPTAHADDLSVGEAGVPVSPNIIDGPYNLSIPGGFFGRYVSNPINGGIGNWQVQIGGAGAWSNIAEGVGLRRVRPTDRIRFRPTTAFNTGGTDVSLSFYVAKNASNTYAENFADEAVARTEYDFGLSASQTLTITVEDPLPPQTIIGFTLADNGISGAVIPLVGTATSNLDVTYESSDPAVAQVRPAAGGSGFELALFASGTATITALQVGSADFAAATPVAQDITVEAAMQGTIMFTSPEEGMIGTPITLMATAQDAMGMNTDLPVTFAITAETPDVAGGDVAMLNPITDRLTFVGSGTVTITASQAGGTSTITRVEYEAATDATQTITVTAVQTLTFTLVDTGTSGNTIPLTATVQDADGNDITAAAGLPAIEYTSSDVSVAEVRAAGGGGQELLLLEDGMAIITASRGGGAIAGVTYAAATAVTQSITVSAATQTLTFVLDDTGTSGTTIDLTVTSQDAGGTTITGAGLPAATYTSSDNTVAEVRAVAGGGQQLVLLMDGMATITASRGGGTVGGITYGAATAVTEDITVSVAAQTLTFVLDDTGTSGEMITLTATSTSGLDVELNITNQSPTTGADDVATLDAGTGVLTLANPGTATITASQAGGTIGDVTYGAATAVPQTITVGEATQTLLFTLDDTGTSGDRLPLSVTSQAGGVDIAAGLPAATYMSSDNTVAEVRGGQLVLLMDGSATITASRGGGTVGGITYGAATAVTQDITVSAATQTLTFVLDDTGTSGEMITLMATSTSGLVVELTITNQSPTTGAADVATLDAGTGVLTLANPGTATITASQAGGTIGDVTYGAATAVPQTITVGEATQTLVFTLANTGTSGDRLPLSVTSQAGGVDIAAGLPAATYTSSDVRVAEVRGGQLVLLMDGTATITALRGGGVVGGVTYAAATAVTQSITVAKATQTIMFTLANTGISGAVIPLEGTVNSGLTITYMSSNTNFAVVRNAAMGGGQELLLLAPGMVTITASRGEGVAGGVTYAAATAVPQTITVGEATQTLVFTLAGNGTSGDRLPLTTTSQNADGNDIAVGLPAVTYTSDARGIAEVSGQQLILKAPGTATITASRAGGVVGGVTYAAATAVTQNIIVAVATQTITFTPPANAGQVGEVINLAATANSGLEVTLAITAQAPASGTGNVATLDAGVLTLVGVGSVTVTASRAAGTTAGEVTYTAATDVTQTFTVTQGTQTVAITSGNTGQATTTTIALTATVVNALGVATGSTITYEIVRETPTTPGDDVAVLPAGTNMLELTRPGTVQIRATAAGDVNTYAEATATQEITVTADPVVAQTFVFNLVADGTSGDEITLAATSQDAAMNVITGLPDIVYVITPGSNNPTTPGRNRGDLSCWCLDLSQPRDG